MDSALATAFSGLQSSARLFQQAAVRAVNANSTDAAQKFGAPIDLASEAVNMDLASASYTANAKVISTIDKMTGALLDIKA